MAAAKTRVLVVDDDRGVLEVARRGLERAGYEVAAVETAAAAERAAETSRFDLVLLDVELPDASGLVALRTLASKAPVVMMSGHADSEIAKDALLLGAKGLLAKPFDLAALCEAIPRYLAR